MSYQVIARKWRPQTFEEVTGQEAITRTLRNAVEYDRLHHAYLFSGARGVGKTTTARLLAKALNCHKTTKPNPTPCSPNDAAACVSCIEIAESRSIDVLEFDAASHTGVDDIRDLILESININPARDRYKIFIIDEVHMLSKSSFNALLKTLEEPPPRVAFIMATTELYKVPDTILSRCQEFEFRTIATMKIFERLRLIADAEKINVTDEALREIARSGEGSMRDAQSNFDQVISFSGEQIEIADVTKALGIAGAEMLTRISKAIADNQPAEVLNVVNDLIGRGHDLRNFCRDLMSFCRDLLIYKTAGDAENLLDTAVLSRAELRENSEPFSAADLIRFFNSLGETETKLREATQPRYILEIGLMKLVEMRRVAPVEKILERLAQLENALADRQIAPPQTENAPAEKKTLKIDFPLEEVPFPVSGAAQIIEPIAPKSAAPETIIEPIAALPEAAITNPPEDLPPIAAAEIVIPRTVIEENFDQPPPENKGTMDLDFIANLPVKLPPITAEELEHIEDNWLDSDYERRLQATGDNLFPIKNAAQFVEILLDTSRENPVTAIIETGGAATAFAPAKAKPFHIPELDAEEEESTEIPILPTDATDEEIIEYAENHPLIKKALRIFRGKIVGVTRS